MAGASKAGASNETAVRGGGPPARSQGHRPYRIGPALAAVLAATFSWISPLAADTLDQVRERGSVRCGLSDNPISARLSEDGRWTGFEVEFCRAIAAAVLGRAEAAEFVAVNPLTRFPSLVSGEVEVIFANLTWTYSREVRQPVDYAAVIYFDGQGFLGHAAAGARRLSEVVDDATVCVMKETTSEINLADYVQSHGLHWRPVIINTERGRDEAFLQGRCTLQTTDLSSLISLMTQPGTDGLYLFPEVISKEPLSAAVRDGDGIWLRIVRWVIYATITAEEMKIGRANIGGMAAGNTSPALRPLLGTEPGFGAPLRLPDDWAFQVIRQVGNYGEIFDGTLGADSPYKLDRGLSRLWNQGGILFAPPLR